MTNKLFSLLLLILLILGIGIFVLPQRETSSLENRELATNKDIDINNLTNSVESVLSDQMYLRDEMTPIYLNLDLYLSKNLQRTVYYMNSIVFLKDNVSLLDDSNYIQSFKFSDDLINNTSKKGFNLNEVALTYPNIKTYVYFPTKLEEAASNNGFVYRQHFLRELNQKIQYCCLEYENVDQLKELFYKTDSHWNNKGAYQGYVDIINMIGKDFDIGAPKNILNEIKNKKKFNGNLGKIVGNRILYDTINDYVLEEIGTYKYYENDIEVDDTLKKKTYYSYDEDYGLNALDDYFCYYPGIKYKKEYDFNNDKKPNILIIGDSFICANQLWIASHFNKTLIYDLRENFDSQFILSDIIKQNNIDIILCYKSNPYMFYEGYFIPNN